MPPPVEARARVEVDWERVEAVSPATASLQVVPNSLFARGSRIHEPLFRALRELRAEDVRLVHWYPLPRLAVAELEPPRDGRTFWDFSRIDPLFVDFMDAMEGRRVMVNFSTVPQWMFATEKPVEVPADPDQIAWSYSQGTELRDPSMKEVADYYARLLGWYTRGGFTDELGVRHESPHRYRFDWWEVFNEPDGEHRMSAEQYTARYDAIVTALRALDPQLKFAGPGLAFPVPALPFLEFFLDPAHHAPGVPLDALTYHFYAVQRAEDTQGACPAQMFQQTDAFLAGVAKIEAIRERHRPGLVTHINEIGALDSDEFLHQTQPGFQNKVLPERWWNASAAVFAYQYGQLARAGIEVVGESAYAQPAGMFPSVSMLDEKTGRPNARYWTLALLREQLGPGDQLLATTASDPGVYAQAFAHPERGRRLLLVNTCDRPIELELAAPGARVKVVDQRTAYAPAREQQLDSAGKLRLDGYGVAVVTRVP